ncbi:hypothetical protein POJ06DRAFT_51343 [Lipomyces tetrasporus]|uniref:NADH:flavin oxidoreductase/NADH oxidase N-terminal domain-containing protein n=1 Tax=Lipomyces tetrasporus TaxID=54092 RepID=A0AAD7QZA4_9ASCO|nr:uncharacterized protein POJ06DRAFT_51343 [Lipomyces tetrasporus]KAJ8102542.1 hypothetical protein POJ06DRAFT_51343 [Lipomyces tetrasporus]
MSDTIFKPLKLGQLELGHRIALAPCTRFRNDDDGSPLEDLMPAHYAQRCLVPGTFLIAEATDAHSLAGGYNNVPGIYTDKQIAAWKKVTDAVHEKKGFIFLQIWALGRVNPGTKQPDVFSASSIVEAGYPSPRELTIEEIHALEDAFATAAKNAIAAGFDGVEIHGAHGYLVDQFIQDLTNKRTDEYGGSVENRAKFPLEIVDKVAAAIGDEKVGIRLSPFSQFQSMGMADPYPQFSYIVSKLQENHPKLAYIHMVEPRASGNMDREAKENESTDPYHKLWEGTWIAAGGFTPETAKAYAEAHTDSLVAFGRYFIANPDLVAKVKEGIPLTKYNRDTFYLPKSRLGYADYEYAPELQGKYY